MCSCFFFRAQENFSNITIFVQRTTKVAFFNHSWMASDWLQVTKRRKLHHIQTSSHLERLPNEIFNLVISKLLPIPHILTLRICSKYFYNKFEYLFALVYRVPAYHAETRTQVNTKSYLISRQKKLSNT